MILFLKLKRNWNINRIFTRTINIRWNKKLVSEAIEKTGAASPRDMGKVMQEIRPKIAGKADGKVVSDMVKQMLA